MDRRQFLSTVSLAASGLLGLVLALPLVGQLLAPLRRRPGLASVWQGLGALADFPVGRPTRVSFPVVVRDGWVTKTTQQAAWVLRGPDELRVLSTICPHLGCSVKWEAPRIEFGCPCHDSGFSPEGEYLHGPARRGLDELPSRVVGDVVQVRWVEFLPGIAERRPVGGSA